MDAQRAIRMPLINASRISRTAVFRTRTCGMRNYHYSDFTIGNVLSIAARSFGDKIFLKNLPDGRTFTFAELDRLSTRVANGLLDAGIRKGSHVALLMENSPEQILAHFALGKIGAVVVPINTAARGQFLA